MDKKQELWMIFTQTGRAQDYLRYREAVTAAHLPPQEENRNGIDDHGSDRPRTQCR